MVLHINPVSPLKSPKIIPTTWCKNTNFICAFTSTHPPEALQHPPSHPITPFLSQCAAHNFNPHPSHGCQSPPTSIFGRTQTHILFLSEHRVKDKDVALPGRWSCAEATTGARWHRAWPWWMRVVVDGLGGAQVGTGVQPHVRRSMSPTSQAFWDKEWSALVDVGPNCVSTSN
jgi:hypothetical protein